jgi:hypothetical protein
MPSPLLIAEFIDREIKFTLKSQGHENTGKTSRGIKYTVEKTLLGYDIVGYSETAIPFILLYGVSKDRIPYGGEVGIGRRILKMVGKKSKSDYIDGLIKYFKSKGFDEETAKRRAFITARKQKQYGMPLDKSKRDHLKVTFDRIYTRLDSMVGEMADGIIKELIYKQI